MPEMIVTVEFRAVTGGAELTLRQGLLELPICARQLFGWLAACGQPVGIIASEIEIVYQLRIRP
jgi:hypothetical protein